jgi:hypothetical protein
VKAAGQFAKNAARNSGAKGGVRKNISRSRVSMELSQVAGCCIALTKARSSYFALDCDAKTRESFVLDRTKSPYDWVRLALHDPPNLELQYQRLEKSCQEKNAKCGRVFPYVPISSGPYAKKGGVGSASFLLAEKICWLKPLAQRALQSLSGIAIFFDTQEKKSVRIL